MHIQEVGQTMYGAKGGAVKETQGFVVTVPQKVKEPPPSAAGSASGANDAPAAGAFPEPPKAHEKKKVLTCQAGMLFSGLDVKTPDEAVASAAPASLLTQGSDLLEDVQLELPVRGKHAPIAGNIMDLDAMTTLPAGAVTEDKKKGKKKHKKEHKEHRSKKESSASSSRSAAAAPAAGAEAAKPVRRRVQRSNVTRPGYGRDEDHPTPVEDIDTESSETAPSRATEDEVSPSPKSPRKDSLLSMMVDVSTPPMPAPAAHSGGASQAMRVSHEAQAGILSGMQIKAGNKAPESPVVVAPVAAAAPAPVLKPTPLQPLSPAPAMSSAPAVAPVVPKESPPKQVPVSTPPQRREEIKVPDVIEIELELPADDEAPGAVGNLLDNRASLRRHGTSALETLVEVFDDESVVPLSRGSTSAKRRESVAKTTEPPVVASTPPPQSQQQQPPKRDAARTVSPTPSAVQSSKPEKASSTSSGGLAKSPAVRKAAVPVPRDAVSLEKEMRDVTEELEASLSQIAREVEKDRDAQSALLKEKIQLQKTLLKLNGELQETRAQLAEAENGENYQMAANLDADLQAVLGKIFSKEKRVREISEVLEQSRRESAVLKTKEISLRRKGLLKLIELQRRREDFTQHCIKEREEYAREREQHISRRVAQLEKTHSGLQADAQMLTENRDAIRAIVEKATGGLRSERETLRERLGDVERDIRELERQLREKNKIKTQVAEKIAKIDSSVRDVRARYDGELGEMDAQLRDKELKVTELDVERTALDRTKREYKDNLVAFDGRITQQKDGLAALSGVVRKTESEIARGERISAGRERDRDALLEIEQSMNEEGDVARESRVRLEEFEFEIKEAQKKLDAIAAKLAEKRAEEEDLRLTRIVRAEQDKKQAAQDRNYKEAQRLRDEVAKMKARCVEVEGDIEELQVQQKEHMQRMESCQKESESEREKLQSLLLETDSSRLGAIERKLRLLLSIKLRINKELKEQAAQLRAAADDARKVDETEGDRKQLAGDLSLIELQIEDSLSECVVLANRCGQLERVDEIKQIIAEAQADEGSSSAGPASRGPSASPRPTKYAPPVEEAVVVEVVKEEDEAVAEENVAPLPDATEVPPTDASVETRAEPGKQDVDEEAAAEKAAVEREALEKELQRVTAEWGQALEEDNYEQAESLDQQMATLKAKLGIAQ